MSNISLASPFMAIPSNTKWHAKVGDSGSLQRVRVLCVDDNELLLKSMQRVVERNPSLHWVGCLERADTLIESVKRLCPDVVVLDIHMPGASALEELHKLTSECPNARVLILSSDTTQATVHKAIERGAWGYISKYDPSSVMIEAIEAVAAKRHFYGPLSRPKTR
jgi:DNA-binding NarL/FixJ family response regulator